MKKSYNIPSNSDNVTSTIVTDVFYNIYIPPNDPKGFENAYNIVEEQMTQVGLNSAFIGTIYYVIIGEPVSITFMNDICDTYNMNCVYEGHFEAGYEMITQQMLLDYCNKEENLSHTVGYIHNKGSLHSEEYQHAIRRRLTRAALSNECIESLSSNQCNVCGANFRSVWGPTFQGNMWSAKCNYIRHLVSPFDLEAKNWKAVKSKPKKMSMNLFEGKDVQTSALGEGRFAAEQFVGNHPRLIPCSFTKPEDAIGSFWEVDPPGRFESHLIRAVGPKFIKHTLKVKSDRLKEWYLLPGILWRYNVIYNEPPPFDSWIWRHYPDGESWKQAVKNEGLSGAFNDLL
jgi:hypothetical protein